ncbi:hypothetical protein BJX76DRAFT_345235 [Aspergillus varians]
MQSCDICRKRKVKCDRRAPCARCRRLRQPCTYTDILRKKGPKFVHSYPRIYTSMPYTNTPTSSETLASGSISNSNSALPLLSRGELEELDLEMGMGMEYMDAGVGAGAHGTGTTSEIDEELGGQDLGLDLGLNFEDISPAQQLQQGLGLDNLDLDPGLRAHAHAHSYGWGEGDSSFGMNDTISLYVETLYPLFPVVDPREIQLGFRFGHGYSLAYGSSRYALPFSLCAAVHAHLALSLSSSEQELGYEHGHERACERYLHDALQARAQCENPQIQYHSRHLLENSYDRERNKILSSFFLFLTYWSLRRERRAWWYLRECIALLLSSRMHREDEYRELEPRETESRRIVFWAVFVAERTFCLLHDKPITLRPWIYLPSVSDDEGVFPGFIRLLTLYLGVRVDLSGCWTAAGFVTPVTLSLATPAAHAHDDMDAGLPIQRLDLAITREWLRAKIWKLGIPGQRSSLEFVASKENEHWRFDEPLSIGKATLGVLRGSSEVLRANWSRILDQKLCDIGECLCDIQPVMQTRRAGESDLDQILQGLLEVLSMVKGRSAYLLRHACQRKH